MHSAVRTTLLCLSVALLMWLVLRQLRSRERAEQRLLVQTALLDELFESAPEAIVMVDRQQRVTRVNREFTTMFGYSAEESQGRTLEELIVPEDLRGQHGSAAAAGRRAHGRGDRTGPQGRQPAARVRAGGPDPDRRGADRKLRDLPRHHRAQAGRGRACEARVEAAPGREAGGDRHHGRRDCARLRQRAHCDPELRRHGVPGRRAGRPGAAPRRARHGGGAPRQGPDQPDPDVQPQHAGQAPCHAHLRGGRRGAAAGARFPAGERRAAHPPQPHPRRA